MVKSRKFFFVFKVTTSALEVKFFSFWSSLGLSRPVCLQRMKKSFVSAFFKVFIDHLFDSLESGKSYCFGNIVWKES